MTGKQILLGKIVAAHGLKGEVKIKSFTADPLDIAAYGMVTVPDGRRFHLERPRVQGDTVIAGIRGISDRNAAEALMQKGAKATYAYATHGVLSGGAVARVRNSALKGLVITDSIAPSEAVRGCANIRILPTAALLGEAIKRIAEERSVSSLFD